MTKMLPPRYLSTTNACKLCKPLGACLAFRGIEGAIPFLHGSQGCATYMRRYIISHFNEPIDIASSSLGEKNAIFGGGPNLKLGLTNVTAKYKPALIGLATTCLTETIGDDVPTILSEHRRERGENSATDPLVVQVSTPSYSGTHMEGFHAAVLATVEQLAQGGPKADSLNLFSGFVSTADLRYLKEVMADFGLNATILPDYSETLDGPALLEYQLIPQGGTPIAAIRAMGRAQATIECGATLPAKTGGTYLAETFQVPNQRLGLPMGIRESDRFFAALEKLSGAPMPDKYGQTRGRLLDSLVDGHKYVFGKRAVVYGEEDLVVGLTAFLVEIGVQPVLCGSGGQSGRLKEAIRAVCGDLLQDLPEIHEGVDFFEIEERAAQLRPDLLVGHSKGYALSRKAGIPLVRVGFPIHDRLGGQRILHLGYQGAQQLFDTIANTLIAAKQDGSDVGYSYM